MVRRPNSVGLHQRSAGPSGPAPLRARRRQATPWPPRRPQAPPLGRRPAESPPRRRALQPRPATSPRRSRPPASRRTPHPCGGGDRRRSEPLARLRGDLPAMANRSGPSSPAPGPERWTPPTSRRSAARGTPAWRPWGTARTTFHGLTDNLSNTPGSAERPSTWVVRSNRLHHNRAPPTPGITKFHLDKGTPPAPPASAAGRQPIMSQFAMPSQRSLSVRPRPWPSSPPLRPRRQHPPRCQAPSRRGS